MLSVTWEQLQQALPGIGNHSVCRPSEQTARQIPQAPVPVTPYHLILCAESCLALTP